MKSGRTRKGRRSEKLDGTRLNIYLEHKFDPVDYMVTHIICRFTIEIGFFSNFEERQYHGCIRIENEDYRGD
jgi:hypothetical protein